jgi:hypothetical protein
VVRILPLNHTSPPFLRERSSKDGAGESHREDDGDGDNLCEHFSEEMVFRTLVYEIQFFGTETN